MLRVQTMATTASTSSALAPSRNVIFHWFRHGDLRLHDNPALVHSCKMAQQQQQQGGSTSVIVPVFCFDPQIFGNHIANTPVTPNHHPSAGGVKCGARRAQFIIECVQDLRRNLQTQCSSPLLVAHGTPATVLDEMIQTLAASPHDTVQIVCQDEVVQEERDAVQAVQAALKKRKPGNKGNSALHTIWGSTMYNLSDLPFTDGLTDMPDVFTPFRNKVEKKATIQLPLAAPSKIKLPSLVVDSPEYAAVADWTTYLPTLHDLGYTAEQVTEATSRPDPRGVLDFRGGETAALRRMQDYIWDQDCLKDYFDTRNGMIGANYSTKFSPWLAHGCLSPRKVAAECRRYEQERGIANKSTYWVVFELTWRDYCKFFAVKYGNAIFYQGGTVGLEKKWSTFPKNLEAWKYGRTGYPLVDANMREMLATGFMSNRGRQNVASFLAIDLGQDWRMGADWFETHLVDYDVYSNWVVSA
jgi:deoxyribodipyrimidine photo-lyase